MCTSLLLQFRSPPQRIRRSSPTGGPMARQRFACPRSPAYRSARRTATADSPGAPQGADASHLTSIQRPPSNDLTFDDKLLASLHYVSTNTVQRPNWFHKSRETAGRRPCRTAGEPESRPAGGRCADRPGAARLRRPAVRDRGHGSGVSGFRAAPVRVSGPRQAGADCIARPQQFNRGRCAAHHGAAVPYLRPCHLLRP